MASGPHAYLGDEDKARLEIDRRLEEAGWVVQSMDEINLFAGMGVAVREYPMAPGHGTSDYLLFVNRQGVGIVEAKKRGTPLAGVEWQSKKYTEGVPETITAVGRPLPFSYESNGAEVFFTNGLDPDPRSRPLFAFHRPETLWDWARALEQTPVPPTVRGRLTSLPPVPPEGLWPVQLRAITALETSLAAGRPRALIQMATGAGKTFTAANTSYRLIKHGGVRRVLFLVDRANLGRQTFKEFSQFVTPDDGRKFTDLYIAQRLSSNHIDPAAKVVISTIQRLYSILRGEEDLDEEVDELSAASFEPKEPVPVAYNPQVPPEFFDVIIIDECHRSIYGVWRQVLEYFDAFLIGLTATPGKQTFGFFQQNLVMEYNHEQAVADGVNVDFDVYRIRTEITERGSIVDAGLVTGFRNRETRATRYQKLDDPHPYDAKALDRAVVAEDQIRTVIRHLRDNFGTVIFPGRTEVPKTLIFAKDDSHADDIVRIVRDEFGKGNDWAVKITYRTTGRKPEELLAEFRNSFLPRIAVTVDMIATGTDIKPLECVVFMRTVKSRSYFEQMKGRGVRVIRPDDLKAVTPDATDKTHFVIVDAVGVTETDLNDTTPLERLPGISLEKLLTRVASGMPLSTDVLSSLASRLSRLDRQITKSDRLALLDVSGGVPLGVLSEGLLSAIDPDVIQAAAVVEAGGGEPTEEDTLRAQQQLWSAAVLPLASNPTLRQKLIDVRRSYEQLLDAGKDQILAAGFSVDATERARSMVTSFAEFIEANKDEIEALHILYSRPYGERLTHKEVKDLAETISRPPHRWTADSLWQAYETLDHDKVRGSGKRILTDLVSLVKFTLKQQNELVPFQETVNERFDGWLLQQDQVGTIFTPEQLQWLQRIRDHIASSLAIESEDFEYTPFAEHGGLIKAYRVFGESLDPLLLELSEVLAA